MDKRGSRALWQIMAAYWFAQYACWLALLTPFVIAIPIKLSEIASANDKTRWLGLSFAIGGALAAIMAPIWGAVSDRTRVRVGKRKFWIMAGSAGLLCGLLVLAQAQYPAYILAGWMICQVMGNATQSALNAVMNDVIPEDKHGLMSALLGVSTTAAISSGVFITQFTDRSSLAMFVVPWLLAPFAIALFVAIVPDAPAAKHISKPRAAGFTEVFGDTNPFRSADFSWALASRLLVMSAQNVTISYQVYFLTDRLHIAPDRVAAFMTLSTSAVGIISLVLSCVAGWISDRVHRRKIFVVTGAGFMTIGLLGATMVSTFDGFLIAIALTSIGAGVYYAVDIALCIEVLPHREKAARDMGIFMSAAALPQTIVPIVGAALLAMGPAGVSGANYAILFGFASVCALIGALTMFPIRGVR